MNNPRIDKYNNKCWYNDKGQLHKEDGQACEDINGAKYWCINGVLHREDGPAVEDIVGSKYWFINGKCHREDGPAVEYWNGSKKWYLDDKEIECKTQEEFEQIKKLLDIIIMNNLVIHIW